MKKIIFITLTALMMMGCNIEPPQCQPSRPIYIGNEWDILKMNDSTYLVIPKSEEYHKPYILKMEAKPTVISAKNVDKKN
jgi:hypothetical protein